MVEHPTCRLDSFPRCAAAWRQMAVAEEASEHIQVGAEGVMAEAGTGVVLAAAKVAVERAAVRGGRGGRLTLQRL